MQRPSEEFQLPRGVKRELAAEPVTFGWGVLGELVCATKYSHPRPTGGQETWPDICVRVVERTMDRYKEHLRARRMRWDSAAWERRAEEAVRRMHAFKMTPPGRVLWAMGMPVEKERKRPAALFNCAFVSTKDMATDPVRPFTFAADALMLGVGVGFDTRGKDTLTVARYPEGRVWEALAWLPRKFWGTYFVVGDSREGWVESIGHLLRCMFAAHPHVPLFDYSRIRPRGAPLKGFGGKAGGPEPLMLLHARLFRLWKQFSGQPVSARFIADVFGFIGACVMAGNIRRSALIALGDPLDEEFLDLKDYTKNPERVTWGGVANNSVIGHVGMDYGPIVERIGRNGEPGIFWLDVAQTQGRIGEPTDTDSKLIGKNPCAEIGLESFEVCCLYEVFPDAHQTLEDFLETLRVAYVCARAPLLTDTHWPETNEVMRRNQRIGISLSGVTQFIAHRGHAEYTRWCDTGYSMLRALNERFSAEIRMPPCIKLTTIKPSGTVSLLAGATPGIHYLPGARFHIRRMRLPKPEDDNPDVSPYVPMLRAAGYPVEPDVYAPETTVVVEIPLDAGEVRSVHEVSVWEQMRVIADTYKHWADNQVSATVTFRPEEQAQLEAVCQRYEGRVKCLSFLPLDTKAYPQMPYERITEAQYKERVARLKPLTLLGGRRLSPICEMPDIPEELKFCTADGCS